MPKFRHDTWVIAHAIETLLPHRRVLVPKAIPDRSFAQLDGESRMPVPPTQYAYHIDVPIPIPLLGHQRDAVVPVGGVDK